MNISTDANRILIPVGCDSVFYALIGELADGKANFMCDGSAFDLLAQEFISQGAVGISFDPSSFLGTHNEALSSTLRSRVIPIDPKGKVKDQARVIFGPVAEELGFDPDRVDILSDPIVGPQRFLLDTSSEQQKRLWKELLLAFSYTYHLLLGISYRLQIDVPLDDYKQSIELLRNHVKTSESGANLAFLAAFVGSYKAHTIGCADFAYSEATDVQIKGFQEFLVDEEFRQYSLRKRELGFPVHVASAVKHLWHHSKELVGNSKFRVLFNYGTRVASASTGIPHPKTDITDIISRKKYAPPIISLANAITKASQRWLTRNPKYQLFHVSYQHFPNLADRLVIEKRIGTIKVQTDSFLGLYTMEPEPDVDSLETQQYFLHYFGVNLTPPYMCPIHHKPVTMDDVIVAWGLKDIRFEISACCENAIKESWSLLCAFDADKDYAIYE